MPADPTKAVYERLKHSLQLLASSADVQLQLLPAYVCKADELALEFDHWREVVLDNYREELSTDQVQALTALDERLDWLTVHGRDSWNDEAVRTSREWQSIRILAAAALRAFGWPLEIPPSYAHEYRSTNEFRRHREN